MIKESQMNKKFVELSREMDLNPVYLKEILKYRNMGYNNTQIAELTGISRVTVNSYVNKIRQSESQEKVGKLILLGLGLYLGAKIIDELFK